MIQFTVVSTCTKKVRVYLVISEIWRLPLNATESFKSLPWQWMHPETIQFMIIISALQDKSFFRKVGETERQSIYQLLTFSLSFPS